ncbi:MAG: hypothetical protein IJQ91_04035 [Acidaminococcaceae bacterium]|nr:hypothetical protein [Acidaminococcaceae bacterium]
MVVPPGALASEFIEKLSNAFTVLTAGSEEEGFQMLIQSTADITALLLDLNLARQSNYSLVEKVNMDKLFSSIPVIALSPNLPK